MAAHQLKEPAGATQKSEPTRLDDLRDLPTHLDPAAVDLLRAEYEHLAGSFLANEEGGEKRVDVLLTLIAAVTAALGLASDRIAADPVILALVVTVASGVLLIYGLFTLRRVMQRNVTTTNYLNGLRRIRATFLLAHPDVRTALLFVPGKPADRSEGNWWGLNRAGFLEMVAATNCLLAALTAGGTIWLLMRSLLPAQQSAWPLAVIAALVAVGVAWVRQKLWARRIYREELAKLGSNRDSALEAWQRELGG